MLAQREFGGLAVHWRVFGSSGHVDPPQQGVLQVGAQFHCRTGGLSSPRPSPRAGRCLAATQEHCAREWRHMLSPVSVSIRGQGAPPSGCAPAPQCTRLAACMQAFTKCSYLEWDTNNLLKTLVNTDYALRPVA
jgi:hypothetical protein